MQQDFLKLAVWCAKWRNKLNPEKTKVVIFSRSKLARKTEPHLKLYGETLEVYPQVKFLGIIFDPQLTFRKDSEDILDHCNTRYHRLKLLANKKWELSPSTIIQIYKQCVQPTFELDNYYLGQYHQQNSTAPKQIYSPCPLFTKIHLC